jgi:hypothetical protein
MVRRIWSAVASGLIVLALFGRLPVIPMYAALVTGVVIAGADIAALVKAWRAGNESIDYSEWMEPDEDGEQLLDESRPRRHDPQ